MRDNKTNNKLNNAFLLLLRPVARLFLRTGRGYREFQALSKAAFVSVASEDYGVHGRPTNASRIAAMTGLTRKEISRIRQRVDNDEAADTKCATPVKDVIAAWLSNEEFLDRHGEPAVLPTRGEQGSLRSLIRQYAGDIPEGAMRKELQRVGVVEVEDDGVRLRSTTVVDEKAEAEVAEELLSGPCPLLAVLAHNGRVENGTKRWPIATIGQKAVPKSELAHVRELVSIRLRAATTTIEDLLDAYATIRGGEGADEPMVPVSAGIYYVEDLGDVES